MSKKNNENKTSLDDLKDDDFLILDNVDLNNVIGGTSQPVAFDTGLPGMVPQ